MTQITNLKSFVLIIYINKESKTELKEIDIKNHMCYHFNDIFKIADFDINNILIDEKPYRNILVYNISYKSFIDSKPLPIRFNKIDGFIRVYNGTRYLALFKSQKYDSIYNSIRYLISVESGITYKISHKIQFFTSRKNNDFL